MHAVPLVTALARQVRAHYGISVVQFIAVFIGVGALLIGMGFACAFNFAMSLRCALVLYACIALYFSAPRLRRLL